MLGTDVADSAPPRVCSRCTVSIDVSCVRIDRVAFEQRLLPLVGADAVRLRAVLDELVPPGERSEDATEDIAEADEEELLGLVAGELKATVSREKLELGKWRTPAKLADFARATFLEPEEGETEGEGDEESRPGAAGRYRDVARLLEDWSEDGWLFDTVDESLNGMAGLVVAPRALIEELAEHARALQPLVSWTRPASEIEDGRLEVDRLLSWILATVEGGDTLLALHHWLPTVERRGKEPIERSAVEPTPEPPAASVPPVRSAPRPDPQLPPLQGPTAVDLCVDCGTPFLSEFVADADGRSLTFACPACGRFQPATVEYLKRLHVRRWTVAASLILSLGGFVTLLEVVRMVSNNFNYWPWGWVLLAPGAVLFHERSKRLTAHDPNANAAQRAGRVARTRLISREEWRRRVAAQ